MRAKQNAPKLFMDKNLENLKKYLASSEENMSAYGKRHILNSDYHNLEEGMNSGTLVKLSKIRLIKYYLSIIPQLLIFKSVMLKNSFIKKYKLICAEHKRQFNLELIIHAIVLEKLDNKNLLNGNICTIGDGKANFVNGVIHNKNINKIYSVNLPQALIQDYLVLTKYKIIEPNLIKVVNEKKDLLDQEAKIFLVPAANKILMENKNINLFVNMFSFQEMPLSETHGYIEVAKKNSAYLYSLNRDEKAMYDGTIIRYQNYGLKKDSEVLFEEEAKFVEKYYNAKFPFIHIREDKILNTLVKF